MLATLRITQEFASVKSDSESVDLIIYLCRNNCDMQRFFFDDQMGILIGRQKGINFTWHVKYN